MQHITDELVGKHVVGPDGERIGKVTGVEDGKAMLKAETGTAVDMGDSLQDEDETLSLTPDQIAEVTDEEVLVSVESR